jgi:hypothetical protein
MADYWRKHVGEHIVNKKYIIKLKHICLLFTHSTNHVRYLESELVSHTYNLWAFISCRAGKMYNFFMLIVRIVTTVLYGDKFNVDFVFWWLAWPFTFGTLLVAFLLSQFSCWYCYRHVLRAVGDITTLLVANPRVCFLNQCPPQYHYCDCISVWDWIYVYVCTGTRMERISWTDHVRNEEVLRRHKQ